MCKIFQRRWCVRPEIIWGDTRAVSFPTGRPRKLTTRHSSANCRVQRERGEILSPPPFFSFSTVSAQCRNQGLLLVFANAAREGSGANFAFFRPPASLMRGSGTFLLHLEHPNDGRGAGHPIMRGSRPDTRRSAFVSCVLAVARPGLLQALRKNSSLSRMLPRTLRLRDGSIASFRARTGYFRSPPNF